MIDIEEMLRQKGWRLNDRCNCSGNLKHSYRNTEHKTLELDYWPRKGRFRVTYLGTSTKIPITSVADLEKTLKELQ